ncbi:hypothetical protein [Catellatospora vulcania]|uniref:hypothetical protein n=1 Tax=Catellatospora vulcania TaxID=1460450 RepID=UPI0012D3F95B|nr:hypothetical protein [Catellatospora vulcania]
MEDTTHWKAIEALNIAVIQNLSVPNTEKNRRDAREVRDNWIFPLYSLDLGMERVPLAELQLARQRWLEREM